MSLSHRLRASFTSLGFLTQREALVGALCTLLLACSTAPSTTGTPASSLDAAAADDAASDDAGTADAAPKTAFGSPCKVGDDTSCGAGLFCLAGPAGGKTGFCTKSCPKTSSAACADAPPGTSAFCLVTDANAAGDKGCAFLCKKAAATFTCPGALKCQTTDEPAGSGQFLCLP
ncbi:MAG: hypothetical protein IPG50_31820 [Myxococcales bacterium]|nr:hypothetical protein [Myxococcales bacterium]